MYFILIEYHILIALYLFCFPINLKDKYFTSQIKPKDEKIQKEKSLNVDKSLFQNQNYDFFLDFLLEIKLYWLIYSTLRLFHTWSQTLETDLN